MKHLAYHCACVIGIACAVIGLSCARQDFSASLPGTWEWTGERCDTSGACRAEIIADEASRETFTRDGRYRSLRAMSRYTLKGNRILLSLGRDEEPAELAEIVSLKGNCLLLRRGGSVRRYERRADK